MSLPGSIIALQRSNRRIEDEDIKAGRCNAEFKAKASALLPDDKREELKAEIAGKIADAFKI